MGNQCVRGTEESHGNVTWNTQYNSNALGTRHSSLHRGRAQSTTMMNLQRDKDMKIQRVNQYDMVKQLGKGSFGDVYLATDKADKFAIKVLRKSALRRQRQGRFGSALDSVKAEVALMKKIRHPNCVGLVEVIDDPKADEVFIVLEFVDGGASQPIGKDGMPVRLKEATIWSHVRHLVLGLEYLHMNGIVHRDIKPDNLLVSRWVRTRGGRSGAGLCGTAKRAAAQWATMWGQGARASGRAGKAVADGSSRPPRAAPHAWPRAHLVPCALLACLPAGGAVTPGRGFGCACVWLVLRLPLALDARLARGICTCTPGRTAGCSR